jgi:hypothetical protein
MGQRGHSRRQEGPDEPIGALGSDRDPQLGLVSQGEPQGDQAGLAGEVAVVSGSAP